VSFERSKIHNSCQYSPYFQNNNVLGWNIPDPCIALLSTSLHYKMGTKLDQESLLLTLSFLWRIKGMATVLNLVHVNSAWQVSPDCQIFPIKSVLYVNRLWLRFNLGNLTDGWMDILISNTILIMMYLQCLGAKVLARLKFTLPNFRHLIRRFLILVNRVYDKLTNCWVLLSTLGYTLDWSVAHYLETSRGVSHQLAQLLVLEPR
jgi:hypothetical protein